MIRSSSLEVDDSDNLLIKDILIKLVYWWYFDILVILIILTPTIILIQNNIENIENIDNVDDFDNFYDIATAGVPSDSVCNEQGVSRS